MVETSGSPAGPVMSTRNDNCIGWITRCLIAGPSVRHRPTIIERIEHHDAAVPRSEDCARIISLAARISQKLRRPARKHEVIRSRLEAGFRVRTAA